MQKENETRTDNDKLFQKTLEYVLGTPKTERQVKTWLFKKRKKSCDDNCNRTDNVTREFLDIDGITSRLKELGYINDAEYARSFTEAKQTKYGKKCIGQKLAQKGVDRNIVDAAVAEIPNQTELVHTLAQKYMRNKTADQKTLQKLYRFLLSKGFDHDMVGHIAGQFKGDN